MTPLSPSDFAITRRFTYLNHAATGPLPAPTREAIDSFVRAQSEDVFGVYRVEARMPEFRTAIGKFLGASGDEIAIVRNTGDGATIAAQGLDWNEGDEVLLCDNEFPSNAIPWIALRSRGVNVRFLETARERMTPDVLRKHLTRRTRVVTVSWVSYEDGYRHDLAGLARVAHEAGALLCVDAIQGAGALPLDVRAVDADVVYGGGQKWLLALQGIAYVYVKRELLNRFAVSMPGWRSMRDMWDFLNYDQPFLPDASRYEGGTPSFMGALALATSVGVLEAAGIERIGAHVLSLTDELVEGLRRMGAELLTERGDGISSGIVTFRIPGCESLALGRALQDEDVVTTWRASGIRVAPHGYNTPAEIAKLLELIPYCVRKLASAS